ncbi:MAG: SGNH/GDSL hydrolase family protein [Opitutus sp.]
MRLIAGITLAIASLVPPLLPAETAQPAGSWANALTTGRVLVMGDSITQDGRYVSFLEYHLARLGPASHHDLISIGLSSETLSGLSEASHPFPRPGVLERLERALKATKPTTVFACYGMNDGIYHPPSPERLQAFTSGLRRLIEHVRGAGARLVLLTPPVFDAIPLRAKTVPATSPEFGYSKPFVGYDQVLAEFATAEVAAKDRDVLVVDVHRIMSEALAKARERDPLFTFTPDGVHPDDRGHLMIARAVLSALGYALATTDVESAPVSITRDPLYVLVDERRRLRSEAWLPFVGYQRGDAFKSASVTAAEQVVLRLQSDIDRLVGVTAAAAAN